MKFKEFEDGVLHHKARTRGVQQTSKAEKPARTSKAEKLCDHHALTPCSHGAL